MTIADELAVILGFRYQGANEARKMRDDMKGIEKSVLSLSDRLGKMAVVAGSALAGIGVGMAATGFVKDITNTGREFENLGIRLTALEGSSEAAAKAMNWIKQFAIETPLELSEVVDAFSNMRAFGMDPTNGSLRAIVDAMAATGGGAEKLDGIVLALGQAWTKQKLQGEEAMQLLERGVPVWDLLSEATGKNAAQLMEMASAGKLGRKEIQLLIDRLGKRYLGASVAAAKTFDGILSNLADNWTRFLLEISDVGYFDDIKRRYQGFLDWVNARWADGSASQMASAISRGLVAAMDTAQHLATQAYRIGRGFYYTADAVADLASRMTGLSKGMAAIGLGLGFAASKTWGRAAMLAMAKRIPWLAAALVVDDIISGLNGDDSVVGSTAGGQAALEGLRGSVAEIKASAEGAADSVGQLFGVTRGEGETALEALGRAFNEWVAQELVRGVRDVALIISDLAKGLKAIDTFLQDPAAGFQRLADAAIAQIDRIVKAIDEKLGGALTRFGFIGPEQLAREPHDYPRLIPTTGQMTRAAPTPITMTPMAQIVRDGMQQIEGLIQQFKGNGLTADKLQMGAELVLNTTEFMNPATAAQRLLADIARTYEARIDANLDPLKAKIAEARQLMTGLGSVTIPVGTSSRQGRIGVVAPPTSP